jgi:hypothetical protein
VSHRARMSDDPWGEFVVEVPNPKLGGDEVPICGLCGNQGIVDTRPTAVTPWGAKAGIVAFCVCPNGRALKLNPRGEELLKDRKLR